jgi:mono/diheme cytochrome c family protein
MRNFLLGILLTIVIPCGVAYLVLSRGYISFRADQQPSATEADFAMSAVDASTDRRAPKVANPVPATAENVTAGAKLYLDNCAGCHGVPSNPDSQFSRSFYPPVPEFFKDAPDMSDNQNFYIIQHGVRWTGMPAWNGTLNDGQIWEVVTFLSSIEKLPPAALAVFGPQAPAAPPPTNSAPPMHMKMDH